MAGSSVDEIAGWVGGSKLVFVCVQQLHELSQLTAHQIIIHSYGGCCGSQLINRHYS